MDKYNSTIGKFFRWINGTPEYAITLGQTTYYSCNIDKVNIEWRKHEDMHKIQWKRDGHIKFACRYVWQLITKGYLNIDYEIEARAASLK